MSVRVKAESVDAQGQSDGWLPEPGFLRDVGPGGAAQLVVSVPPAHLAGVHQELVRVLGSPLKVLYRQVVDRRDPKPEGFPPRDFVGLDVAADRVLHALALCRDLIYGDARCEVWIAGPLGDEIVLDPDGLVFCRPDDPAFRDVLMANGLPEGESVHTIADRDYVKHWFHGACDAQEDTFLEALQLSEVPHRGG